MLVDVSCRYIEKREHLQVDQSAVPRLHLLQDLVLLEQLLQSKAFLVEDIVDGARAAVMIRYGWSQGERYLAKLMPPSDQMSPCMAANWAMPRSLFLRSWRPGRSVWSPTCLFPRDWTSQQPLRPESRDEIGLAGSTTTHCYYAVCCMLDSRSSSAICYTAYSTKEPARYICRKTLRTISDETLTAPMLCSLLSAHRSAEEATRGLNRSRIYTV